MDRHKKYHLQGHQHNITRHTETTTPGQAVDTTEQLAKGETGPDHSLASADSAAPAIMTCTNATPDHNKGTDTATIEAAQGDPIQHTKATVTEPTMTHLTSHTADHPHTTAHQVTTLKTIVDHIHAHPTDCQNIIHTTEASCSSRSYSNQGI